MANPFVDVKAFALSVAMTILLMAVAAAILLLRDRRTLAHATTTAERRRIMENNTAGTVNLAHILFLVAAIAAVAVSSKRHQSPWLGIGEAGLAAFVVFRYYRQRSEETVKPDSDRNRPQPIH